MSVYKWTVPLTLAGLGGLGAMLFSRRGRKLSRCAETRGGLEPGRRAAWNDSAQQELDYIQQAVDELEQSIGTHTAQ